MGPAAMLACCASDFMARRGLLGSGVLGQAPQPPLGSMARLLRRPGQPAAAATVGRGLRPGLCRAPWGAAGNRCSCKQAWSSQDGTHIVGASVRPCGGTRGLEVTGPLHELTIV